MVFLGSSPCLQGEAGRGWNFEAWSAGQGFTPPQPSPASRGGAGYWQASQDSGFSNEHTTAAVASGAFTVVLAIFVAGRERR